MRLILALTMMTISASSFAGWEVRTTTDAMTDAITIEAFVESQEGHRFTLLRRSDNSLWGFVRLAGLEQFSINERLMMRVDKNEPFEFNDDFEKLMERLGQPKNAWEWNPSLIGFLMPLVEKKLGCEIIKQLLHGSSMILRFHPNQSTIRDITFPINGNQKAVSDAFGFNVETCPEI